MTNAYILCPIIVFDIYILRNGIIDRRLYNLLKV